MEVTLKAFPERSVVSLPRPQLQGVRMDSHGVEQSPDVTLPSPWIQLELFHYFSIYKFAHSLVNPCYFMSIHSLIHSFFTSSASLKIH